jgi:hypothetical protein
VVLPLYNRIFNVNIEGLLISRSGSLKEERQRDKVGERGTKQRGSQRRRDGETNRRRGGYSPERIFEFSKLNYNNSF